MIRRPPRSTQSRSSAASDVYKRQRIRDVFAASDLPTARDRAEHWAEKWRSISPPVASALVEVEEWVTGRRYLDIELLEAKGKAQETRESTKEVTTLHTTV